MLLLESLTLGHEYRALNDAQATDHTVIPHGRLHVQQHGCTGSHVEARADHETATKTGDGGLVPLVADQVPGIYDSSNAGEDVVWLGSVPGEVGCPVCEFPSSACS